MTRLDAMLLKQPQTLGPTRMKNFEFVKTDDIAEGFYWFKFTNDDDWRPAEIFVHGSEKSILILRATSVGDNLRYVLTLGTLGPRMTPPNEPEGKR